MNRLVNDCDTIKNGKIEEKSSNSEINRNLLEMKQEIINTQAQRIEHQDMYLKILTDNFLRTTQKIIDFNADSQTMLKDVSETLKKMK